MSYFNILSQAKLPRGIGNIRPHLESVDNVPLLVNLFTDCTPESKYNFPTWFLQIKNPEVIS